MRLLPISVLCILPCLAYAQTNGIADSSLQPLITHANALLSSGKYADAATAYSNALVALPEDQLLHYKRATAYYSLGRYASAVEDCIKVRELGGGMKDRAELMMGRIYMREGRWDDVRDVMTSRPGGAEADDILAELSDAERLAKRMQLERRSELWTACVETAGQVLKTASYSIPIREVRADCALKAGDVEGAAGDLTRLAQLLPSSQLPALHTRIFLMSFLHLPPSPATLTPLKQCLHLDPDSKICLPLHRLAKSFEKGMTKLEDLVSREDWTGIIRLVFTKDDLLGKYTKLEEDNAQYVVPGVNVEGSRKYLLLRAACMAYTHITPVKGLPYCKALLDIAPEDVDGLIGTAEVHLKREEYQEAVSVLEKAFEASGRSRRDVHTKLNRAQKLLKQSLRKDYYKVLGIGRDATQAEVKKAFRTKAKEAHPDKGGSEAAMAALNEAYEVISNPELRARFDNGEDPNDPESQSFGGSGHPFAHFFQQGAGGFPGGGSSGGGFPGGGGFKFKYQG